MKETNSKVTQVVKMLSELGVKVHITQSRFDLMSQITYSEKLQLKEQHM